jgi:LysR family transcriptional regulator, transcriptional activator of the cysJI operon
MAGKLDLYKVFYKVGKNESFSRAAKELYMSQPAVSQSVMQLERELGIRLFNRTPKGVKLTNEGSLLYEYVSSALSLIDVAEEKIAEFKNLTAGELKIGVGDTISRFFMLPYLEAFHNQYPNMKFKIVNGTTFEICTLLKSGEVDIGICNFPLHDPTLELRPCVNIQDIFVCGEKYRDKLPDLISLEDIAKHPLILLEPKSNSRKYVEDFMLSKGIKVAPEFELGSHDLLLEFAKINLGVACVIKQFSQDYLEKQFVYEVPITESVPERSIGVCYLKSVPLSPASMKFVEMIEISCGKIL